jgi:chromosomal replication initiation ATPase DnaA
MKNSDIIDICFDFYGDKRAEVLSPTREADINKIRHTIWMMLRRHTNMSYEHIEHFFGCGRRRVNIMQSIKMRELHLKYNLEYRQEVEKLNKIIEYSKKHGLWENRREIGRCDRIILNEWYINSLI